MVKQIHAKPIPPILRAVNIQDIPLKKVHVGDIDIAYKIFGKGNPIILHNGASDSMNAWDPSFLKGISSNHTVIVFDSRGIGNRTAGTKPYSIQLLANDTAGLMDALKIQKGKHSWLFSWFFYNPAICNFAS